MNSWLYRKKKKNFIWSWKLLVAINVTVSPSFCKWPPITINLEGMTLAHRSKWKWRKGISSQAKDCHQLLTKLTNETSNWISVQIICLYNEDRVSKSDVWNAWTQIKPLFLAKRSSLMNWFNPNSSVGRITSCVPLFVNHTPAISASPFSNFPKNILESLTYDTVNLHPGTRFFGASKIPFQSTKVSTVRSCNKSDYKSWYTQYPCALLQQKTFHTKVEFWSWKCEQHIIA